MKTSWIVVCAALASFPLAAEAQHIVGIGTNPQGSLTYTVGAGIAKVIQDKLAIQARIQPSGGSSTLVPPLNRGELDFILLANNDVETAYAGTGEFTGKPNPNLRAVGVLFPISLGVAVVASDPYKSVRDLKGLRLPAEFPSQLVARPLQEAMLATAGLKASDFKAYPVANLFKGVEALGQGRVDAAAIGVGSAQVQQVHAELSSKGGVRFISLDASPEAVARMKSAYNGSYIEVFQPAPQYPGILGPTNVISFSEFFLASSATPEELVYRVTKILHASKPELAAAAGPMRRFDPDRMAEATPAPYHPGAEKFYREIGQWPPRAR